MAGSCVQFETKLAGRGKYCHTHKFNESLRASTESYLMSTKKALKEYCVVVNFVDLPS